MDTVINKGTGAGGANTNKSGKAFEEKTSNEGRLLAQGFVRKDIPGKKGGKSTYLEKIIGSPEETIVYLTQSNLKAYFAAFFQKKMCRHPDEAYLFRHGANYTLKVLEKKDQHAAGSVDTKLMTGDCFTFEYKFMLGEAFDVNYAYCLSAFLQKDYQSDAPKYQALRAYNQKNNITVLFGDEPDYYVKLDDWLLK